MKTCLLQLSLILAGMGWAVDLFAAERQQYAPNSPDVLRVVVFGDSITGNRPAIDYRGDYLKYADLLQLMLEARLGVGKVEVINSGWAGDKTHPRKNEGWPGGVGRLEEDLIAYGPDLSIILFGGNDNPKTEERARQTQDNLQKIYQGAKDSGSKVLAVQYPEAIPDPSRAEKAWRHLQQKSDPLIAAAAKAAGVEVHSLAPAMAAAREKYPDNHLVVWPDGVHLKPQGEIVVARSLFEKLDELGWVTLPKKR